jgi:cytochrome c oxidase subunit 3
MPGSSAPDSETLIENDRGGLPPIHPELPFGGGGDGDSSGGRGEGRSVALLGLIVGMIASTMTFAALAATLILRHALSGDWVSLPVPSILWPNTILLLLSSVAIELARRALHNGKRERFNQLWWTGIILGSGFLTGQTVAWLQLRARGVYMSTNPSHGLFYILTWTHAAHAIGALIALIWVGVAALRYRLGPRKRTGVAVSSIFWHFLDVMWLCLMALFVKWG